MFKRKNVVLTQSSQRVPASVPQGSKPARQQHSSVRPSLITSTPCVTTGSRTLDKALAHGGVPTGTLTLIEEHGTTDFGAALLKSACALAVQDSREGRPTKVICVGIPEWLRALPSLSQSKRPQSSSAPVNDKMKIAWRYAKYSTEETDSPNQFCRDVDFKSTMHPAPQSNEVAYVLGGSLSELTTKLSTAVQGLPPSMLVRVVVPSFLHPAVYDSRGSEPGQMLPFMAQLKRIVASHGNAVAFVSIPLQLYPRTKSVVAGLELLVDTCIELEPFDSGDEKVQGFLHINRIAGLTDRGEYVEQRRELSFRLGRYQLEISPYAIPVEAQSETEHNDKHDW